MIPGVKNKILEHVLKTTYGIKSKKNAVNVTIVARNIDTPTSSTFIRLISPLSFGAAGRHINISLQTAADASKGINKDAVVYIVQRTAFESLKLATDFISQLRANKVKLIVDTDDAFSKLDKSHPQYDVQKGLSNILEYVIEKADRVWVSTSDLARGLGSKTVVFSNTLDTRLFQDEKKLKNTSQHENDHTVRAVYMGTGTHDDDLATIVPAIDKINEKYDGLLELTVIGVAAHLPDRKWLKRLVVGSGFSLYPKFVRWFMQQGPYDIGLAPLVSSDFNKAKSDIKVLDYLNIGVIPVVSDLEPYASSELDDYIVRVGYKSEDWFNTFEDIILNKGKYLSKKENNAKRIKKYIRKDRSTKNLSKMMLKDIQDLLKNS